jgi:hypothetical protein
MDAWEPTPATRNRRRSDHAAAFGPEGSAINGIDERAATQARERYRDEPMEPIDALGPITDLLGPAEQLLAVRNDVRYDRRAEPDGPGSRGLAGDLYLTSSRLILLGSCDLTYGLDDIEEMDVSGERLRLMMGRGAGLSLDVDQPRLLRVEIAAARAGRALEGCRRYGHEVRR